jgi:phage terminase Nu1 subunit (DNA packaging protein)
MAGPGTVADIADFLGISTRRVAELQAEGTIPKGDTRAAVRAYCAHIRPASGRAASGGSDAVVDLDTARVRLLTAQADAREMLNSQMRAETMTAGDVEAVVGAVVDGTRAKALALPTRAAPLLVGLTNMAEIRDLLTGLVHDTLTELASAEVVTKVADRARSRAGRSIESDPPATPASTAA